MRWPQHSGTSYPAVEGTQRPSAEDVKGISPLMILMVIIYLMLLFWENEQNEEGEASTIEHLHVDYPQSDVPVRYCNHMVLQRVIRGPDNTCKKEHVFIHERPRNINSVCLSPKTMNCQNHSATLCFQSLTEFKMTVCQLVEGTRYPACRYHMSSVEGFIVVTCDNMGPVTFQRYVK
ncbi:probable inactive ribonuclease-like protein 12 isoform X1 [Suricata suricatta]|uniref:Inactive ribonuclease-like protein 10 n=2 Tax=Suricata suricatta TaxID=37032 RepID=A0A673TAY5_SURSU|nr:probable inactive ribonuclease-like protein 12 isoform X1 [Suricata suricatta]